MSVNVDFTFDFKKHLTLALQDSHQDISDIAEKLDSKSISVKNAIYELIAINISAMSDVLNTYNKELLNEIEL